MLVPKLVMLPEGLAMAEVSPDTASTAYVPLQEKCFCAELLVSPVWNVQVAVPGMVIESPTASCLSAAPPEPSAAALSVNLRQLPLVVGQPVELVSGDTTTPLSFQVLAWFTDELTNVGVPTVQVLVSVGTTRRAVMVPVAVPVTTPDVP